MNTAAAPENAMADKRKVLFSAGLSVSYTSCTTTQQLPHNKVEREITYKFLEKLARDQSSASNEKVIKTGIERRLL
jgi:hypothetical protein